MLITLNNATTGKKHQTKIERHFDKLRQQLEKQKKLKLKFQQDLDDLVSAYHAHIHQASLEQFETLVALTKKLILFASRKSLSDWHRDELSDWTRDLVMDRIAPIDPEMARQLQSDYIASVAKTMGLSPDELHMEFEALMEQLLDEEQPAENPDEIEDADDDIFGFGEFDPRGDGWSQDLEDEIPPSEDLFKEPDPSLNVMDSEWIKTLFRRTAQNLHPDRETDSKKHKQKQKQLSELLSARKANDVLTMIKIHNEVIKEHDLKLSEQEIAGICELIEDQIDQLNLDRISYIHANPMRHMVYDLFYHSSKSKRQSALNEWQQSLDHEHELNRNLLVSLTTLNDLKVILKERRIQRAEFHDWITEDEDSGFLY